MTSTPEMQRRARLKRKAENRKSKVEQVLDALKKKEPIPSICKRLIITPLRVQRLMLEKQGAKFLKLKGTRGSRSIKGRK